MPNIVQVKKNSELVYPQTHQKAIIGGETIVRGSAIIDPNKTEVLVAHNLGGVTSEMIMILPRSIVTSQYRIAWVDENNFRILLNTPITTNNIIFTYWIIKGV